MNLVSLSLVGIAVAFLLYSLSYAREAFGDTPDRVIGSPEALRDLAVHYAVCVSPLQENATGFSCMTRQGRLYVDCGEGPCRLDSNIFEKHQED